MSRPASLRLGLAVLAGLLLTAAQAPVSFWPALPLGLILAVHCFTLATSPKTAAWTGWIIGTVYFATSLNWIVEPFFVDAPRHGWMAPFALLSMAGGLAVFWSAAFWGASRLKRPWALVAFWPLVELARGYVLTGFPWGLWSYGWLDTPIAQSAAWIGPYGLSALTLALCAVPVLWRRAWGSAAMALGLAIIAGLGVWDRADRPGVPDTAPIIRLTQPNAPQHLKWDPEHIPIFFSRQIAFTAAAPKPDLIVWPETSVPAWLNEADRTLERIHKSAKGAPVIMGIQRYEGPSAFNTAALMDASGAIAQVYDKHHLVPFGEYLPLAPILSRLGLGPMVESASGFAPGPGPQLIDLPGIGRALPLICYEAVFPRLSRSPEGRPDFLLHLTNDAWFGTWAGPQQHLAQARFRAIEQGLPLLRSANTGISAVISAHGEVMDAIALGQSGYLDAPLPQPTGPTFYTRASEWPVSFILILLLCATIWPRRTKIS